MKNPLFRLLLINGLAGAGLGIVFVAGVLSLDLASLRTLLVQTGEWAVGLSLLVIGSVSTFASVAMGGAIMLVRSDRPKTPPSGKAGPLVYARQAQLVRRSR
jgi:hypothetical protein